ncbi:tail collar protein [Synechococcus phage ACG-2014h]|uniref:Virion structural protein n=1 Tax=Synechococcus phage ACG-2014h TaxID=1340810 RepID=V5USF4_9CAUD|nr:tail collar protein [Synechococcus phage ACG-2014h]AHB80442.1 virion structural protein [Synechococcus phage ACG-2014h]
MAANYSFERGKYGVFPGTIIAFSRTLEGNDPNGTDYRNYIPAGYLRCDGKIFSGIEYPNLKQILGVGENSKFRKPDTTLEEDVAANESGGTFQLPDLGAKYIQANSASGVYTAVTVADEDNNEIPRVGIETDLSLNRGTSVTVNYSGSMAIPQTELDFLSNQNFGTTLGVVTDQINVVDTSYLSHGHFSNLPVWAYDNDEDYSTNMSISDSSPELQSINSVGIIGQVTPIAGSQTLAVHQHVIQRSFPNRNTEAYIPSTDVDAFNVTTAVTLSAKKTLKMDDIVPTYILVEYLIKY